MKKLHYDPHLNKRARELRNHATLAEILLWKKLKRRQMLGYQFLRQRPLEHFIVDFFCHRLRLIIEIDGRSHNGKEKYDAWRQKQLEEKKFHFLRFTNDEIFNNMEDVLRRIEEWIMAHEQAGNKSSGAT